MPWRHNAHGAGEIVIDVNNFVAHFEHSDSALSAWNFRQTVSQPDLGPKFLVGDVCSVFNNSTGRAPGGWLPWLHLQLR